MEWIVNFCNRTPWCGGYRFVLTDLMYCHLYSDVTVFMPLIMDQHMLFFDKKKFQSFKFWFILLDLVAKMSSGAKLKGLNLRYHIAWWDFLLRNTMSTGKLKNMMFRFSHFWDEKRPTKNNLRTVFQLCCCQLVHGPLPRPALKDFWNNRRQESVPFVSKIIPSGPSRLSVHGLPPRPALTDFWNNRREESVRFVSKVHPSGPSRTSVHGLPRPALTDFWNNQREEAVPFVSKVHLGGPSRTSVHGPPPRPALTDFWNTRRKESVPFVSKVHPGGASRTSVHGPPPRPALTDFWNNRREESVPFVSKVHPSGPSRPAVHGPPPRPALTDFWNNRREESVPFVSKVHPGGPSRTSVTARSDELLKQTAPQSDDKVICCFGE